ncbi:DNA polymerase I [Sphaerospermopsis aphanizomenoides BCCUSP55]|uniref:DNA polymerase I n=1 Tax=Sphaerospermopsis aphanizomenoides TaxID=459663 RepID=UPI0019073CA5|nr:DNA polymerase I [Sphaerospermopsis aphanizomenoides]MBK1989160.1 DNA polymerase I [Sphaerospermopsis aphanizomenoides BCCUSP55]
MSQNFVSKLTYHSTITNNPTFILVDGHSLAFRSYFAFAKGKNGGLRTKAGIPTSVCFGFLKCLLEVMTTQQPQAMAIAFDLGLPTFRHEADDTYKADRLETPEDFIPDLENLHELLRGLNLPIFTAPGYEADDVLGTLAQKASAAGYRVKILSGDRDLFQLIDAEKEISVLNFSPEALKRSANSITEFQAEQVKEKLGVLPTQIVDFKALCGYKSDNIPGVKGIGEKTAVKLLNTYNSLDEIYAKLDEITGANQDKLVAGKEDALHSQYLAKIVVDVPLEVNLEDCQLTGFDTHSLIPILEKLEFKKFLEQINELQQKFGGKVPETKIEKIPAQAEDDDLWFFSAEDTANAEKQSNSLLEIRIIDTTDKLQELVSILEKCTNLETPVAWDTETTDLELRDAALVGVGCCWGTDPDQVAYIPAGHKIGKNLELDLVLEALRPILESANYTKTFQNAKFDRLVFRLQGINLNGVVLDPMLASYFLNPVNTHNLSDLSLRYLGLQLTEYNEIVPKASKKELQLTIANIGINTVANYCGTQVYATFQLVDKLRAELEKAPDLYKLLVEVEQPLEAVLAEMEYTGVRIYSQYLKELSLLLELDLEKLETKATEIAGEKFNLGSPKQLSYILFEKLGLSTKYSRKIQTGYSTDAATLEKLQEIDTTGFVDAIIEYRTLSKLKSTYVDALPALVHPKSQRVHTDFNQAATSTGRLSSSNPNLQNIPIRTAFSRQIRKAFLPESGWLMVAADYSQIELRILAHLSKEPVLIQAYKQNEDIHTVTAKLVFEKDEVTSEERRFAKTINFGVIYGMGSLKFSRSTGIDKNAANEFIKRFNERYPDVFAYLERVKKEAISQGYVETICGRRRYFDFTSKSLKELRGSNLEDIDLSKLKNLGPYDAGLLRSAANAPIQGSSADIIKIAMVQLHEVLKNYQARLLLQVHDELVFEVPPQEWEELQPQIKSVMENAVSLSVPLVVDVRAGDNWMETK